MNNSKSNKNNRENNNNIDITNKKRNYCHKDTKRHIIIRRNILVIHHNTDKLKRIKNG